MPPKLQAIPAQFKQQVASTQAAGQDASTRRAVGMSRDLAAEASERDIQKAIMLRLSLAGWCVVRINSGCVKKGKDFIRFYSIQGLNAISGLPDIFAMKGNRLLLIEVKDAKGKLRLTQQRFIDHAKRHGVTVHVLRHPSEIEKLLRQDAAAD